MHCVRLYTSDRVAGLDNCGIPVRAHWSAFLHLEWGTVQRSLARMVGWGWAMDLRWARNCLYFSGLLLNCWNVSLYVIKFVWPFSHRMRYKIVSRIANTYRIYSTDELLFGKAVSCPTAPSAPFVLCPCLCPSLSMTHLKSPVFVCRPELVLSRRLVLRASWDNIRYLVHLQSVVLSPPPHVPRPLHTLV